MKKYNVILDIDETLITTYMEKKDIVLLNHYDKIEDLIKVKIYNINDKNGDGSYINILCLKRPDLDLFLLKCREIFDNVIIWSAGEYKYVHSICRKLFKGLYSPDKILTRNDIIYESKPINHIIDNYPEFGVTLSNTIIIDDLNSNFYHNKNNGILIPRFRPKKTNIIYDMYSDNHLKNIMKWMEDLNHQDIRKSKLPYNYF